jgi:hypothetical protein
MASASLPSAARGTLDTLASDLRRVFGNRLHAVCAYGPSGPDTDIRSIVLVDRLAFEDLVACVPMARRWDDEGLAVPLILDRDEFDRTLDVFPLEYGEIIASHVLIYGDDPFEGIAVDVADRRRGCELQAKSHLIHLREGYLESRGDPGAVSALIAASAEGFRRLLLNMVMLVAPSGSGVGPDDLPAAAAAHLNVPADLTREVLASASIRPSTITDPTALLARYISAVEGIWEFVDAWKRT